MSEGGAQHIGELNHLLERAAGAKHAVGGLSRVSSYVGAATAEGNTDKLADITRILIAASNDTRFSDPESRVVLQNLAVVTGRAGDTWRQVRQRTALGVPNGETEGDAVELSDSMAPWRAVTLD